MKWNESEETAEVTAMLCSCNLRAEQAEEPSLPGGSLTAAVA